MNIALADLDLSLPDMRTVPPPKEADDAMLATIREWGVLQAILVRPMGNQHQVVLGRRRVRLAREAGLTEIPAEVREMTDAEAFAAQVTENVQRAVAHPIDLWRATKEMLGLGLTVRQASLAIGLDERGVRRNERLAELHPQLLALAEREMPNPQQLAAIASAPQEVQAQALKVPHAVVRRDVNWSLIAHACRATAIPRARAIFDAAKSPVVFEEDLFAQPGSPEQFVTHDAAGFLKAQKEALATQVAARQKKGEGVELSEWGNGYSIRLPRGWTQRAGEAPGKPRLKREPGGPLLFVAVCDREDWRLGEIVQVIADPPPQLHRAAAAAPPAVPRGMSISPLSSEAGKIGAANPAPAEPEEDGELERAAITKKGQMLVAAWKTEALRKQIREQAHQVPLELLAGCLVLALAGDNVKIEERRWHPAEFDDLAPRLVDVAGRVSIDAGELRELLAEALARMLVVTDPVLAHGSGDVAEWIGAALGADAALPRFDHAEFLAQLSGDELRRIAREADVSVPKKVSELRTTLVGRAAAWRPTTFGAPGPRPEAQTTRNRAAEDIEA